MQYPDYESFIWATLDDKFYTKKELILKKKENKQIDMIK